MSKTTEPSNRHSCKRCGFAWTARVLEPRACPGCKSYHWRTPRSVKYSEVTK
jgi:predicted Zn-ribbon and HTH transcriptional regulator